MKYKAFRCSVLLAAFVLFSVLAQHATAATEDVPNPGVEMIEGLEIGLETAIRKELNITNADQPLTIEDLEALTSLVVYYNSGISSLKGLEQATNLTELRIYSNRISDLSPLRGLTNLTHLDLRGNVISDISPLSGLTNLRDLVLDDNQISNVSVLKNLTNLRTLGIENNAISDISPLSGLTNLTDLYFAENKIINLSGLSSLTKLRYLDLGNNKIRDVSPLASLTGLKRLYLEHNPIANIDPIKPIIEDGKLNRLGLEGTAITADDRRWLSDQEWEGMQERGMFLVRYNTGNTNPAAEIPNDALRAHLQDLEGTDGAPTHKFISGLESLNLSDKDIGNFTGLEAAINLTSLTINDANMTNKRLLKLAEILKHLPDLRVLHLDGNKISNIASLASVTQLTSLHLSQNNITDVSSLSALSNLTDLSLSDNSIANIEGLGSLTGLKSLDLHGNHKLADISPLARLVNLTDLFLSRNRIVDVSPLAGLTSLTDLFLSRNRIVDVSPLAGLTNLQRLTLNHNRIADFDPISSVTDNLIEYRKGNQKVDPIAEFTDDNLRRAVLQALGKDPNSADPIKVSEMATLTTLTAPDAGIRDLTGLQHAVNLKTLDLSGNALNDDDMDRLTRLTQLETLILTGNDNITSAKPFRKLRNLTRLDLPQGLSDPTIEISDTGLRTAILRALGKTESPETNITASELHGLEKLEARGFGIRDLTGLEHAENLKQLYLNDNQISDLSPLAGLQRLRRLSLNKNNISDVKALSGVTTLRWLRLNNNRISTVSPLDTLVNLKTLELGNNRFSDASPLEALTALENLHLDGNPIKNVDSLSERLKGLIDIPGVQAAVYNQLDVNRDGTVDQSDVDIVSRFVGIPSGDLIAIENASNVYPDVDGDGDVDQDDVDAVMAAGTGEPGEEGPEAVPGDGQDGSGL